MRGPARKEGGRRGWTRLGARVMIDHRARTSTAPTWWSSPARSPATNPSRAGAAGQRAGREARRMLGELMPFRYSIAVAGTHGRPPPRAWSRACSPGGRDPTFVIGGRLKGACRERPPRRRTLPPGRRGRRGDASFLHLQPMIAVVTNVDADHLGTHGSDFAKLRGASSSSCTTCRSAARDRLHRRRRRPPT